MITKAQWYHAFDYHKINLDNTPKIIDAFNNQHRWLKERRVEFNMPSIPVLKSITREKNS